MSTRSAKDGKSEARSWLIAVWVALSLAASGVFADGQDAGLAAPVEPPPLPLHAVEGVGGTFAVHSAYVTNPPASGEILGLPSVGGIYVHFGQGRHLDAFTLTETLSTPLGLLELGYAWNHFDAGDLHEDVLAATKIRLSDHAVDMHNFNARLQVVKEGAFDQSWAPALTFGVHYKYNDTIQDMDRELLGTLRTIGIKDDYGIDYTLYASKMITAIPRHPVILSAGLRSTEAAHIGLLGFTGERKIVAEGSLCVFATDRFILAAEYRQKPNEYKKVPGLIESEDDWWTLCGCYLINDHATIAIGYANFGEVLNHKANGAWGVAFKYEL